MRLEGHSSSIGSGQPPRVYRTVGEQGTLNYENRFEDVGYGAMCCYVIEL